MQFTNEPPLPFLPAFLAPQNTPVYLLSTNGIYIYDDRSIDYQAMSQALQTSVSYPPSPWDGNYGGGDTNIYPPGPLGMSFGPDDLVLFIDHDLNPAFADLSLHGTHTGTNYQWLAVTNLVIPFPQVPPWVPGEIIAGQSGVFAVPFTHPVLVDRPMRFFRAVGGDVTASIYAAASPPVVAEPCNPSQTNLSAFTIYLSSSVSRDLTIPYTLSGSAEQGTDYYTNTTRTVVLKASDTSTNIYIRPRYDTNIEFEESVTITLGLNNGYLLDPDHYTDTLWIQDCTNYFTIVATNVPSPASIDYHSISNALLIGINFDTGEPNNFALLGTNHQLQAWSGVHGIPAELKFATIRETNSPFTNANVYFDTFSSGGIGMLSWDGTRSNLTWCQLTNELDYVNTLYADRTGTWSNDLLAITADIGTLSQPARGVWRIHSQTNLEQVTRVPALFLEGLITIPADSRYGPWAGKLLTGDENTSTIYAVATNGTFETFRLGIDPDDFQIILASNDVYCVNFQDNDPPHSQILKVSRTFLNGHIGDVLITQAGETPGSPPCLFFVHWNSTTATFEVRRALLPDQIGGHFEHVTVAPLSIPDL